jgi:hypothetical protein
MLGSPKVTLNVGDRAAGFARQSARGLHVAGQDGRAAGVLLLVDDPSHFGERIALWRNCGCHSLCSLSAGRG